MNRRHRRRHQRQRAHAADPIPPPKPGITATLQAPTEHLQMLAGYLAVEITTRCHSFCGTVALGLALTQLAISLVEAQAEEPLPPAAFQELVREAVAISEHWRRNRIDPARGLAITGLLVQACAQSTITQPEAHNTPEEPPAPSDLPEPARGVYKAALMLGLSHSDRTPDPATAAHHAAHALRRAALDLERRHGLDQPITLH